MARAWQVGVMSIQESGKCARCGLLMKERHPHTVEECIQELQHCRQVAVEALQQCRGILRAFVQDKRTVNRMDQVIDGALEEIESYCGELVAKDAAES